MAVKSATGGGNRVAVFSETAGQPATEQIIWDKHVNSPFTGSLLTNNLLLDIDNKVRNPAWLAHLRTYLTKLDLAPFDVTYEDGTQDSGVNMPPAAYRLVAVHADGELDGSRLITCFRFAYTGETGSSSRESGSLGDTPIQFTSIPASETTTVGSVLLNDALSDICSVTVDFVFSAGEYGSQDFINVTTGAVTTP